jgi:hypothetical protein
MTESKNPNVIPHIVHVLRFLYLRCVIDMNLGCKQNMFLLLQLAIFNLVTRPAKLIRLKNQTSESVRVLIQRIFIAEGDIGGGR